MHVGLHYFDPDRFTADFERSRALRIRVKPLAGLMRLGHCVQSALALHTQIPSICCSSFKRGTGQRELHPQSRLCAPLLKPFTQHSRCRHHAASDIADSGAARSLPVSDHQALDDRQNSQNGASTSDTDDEVPHVPVLLDEVCPSK